MEYEYKIIYDIFTKELAVPIDNIEKVKPVMLVSTYRTPFDTGEWLIIGNQQLPKELQLPYTYYRIHPFGYYLICTLASEGGYEEKRVSSEECIGLLKLENYDPQSLVSKLNEIHASRNS